MAGASSYVVFVKVGDNAPTILGVSLDTHLSRKVPPGPIEWWVIAMGSGCDGMESLHRNFTVPEPSACASIRRPHPLEPEDDSVDVADPYRGVGTNPDLDLARLAAHRHLAAGLDPVSAAEAE